MKELAQKVAQNRRDGICELPGGNAWCVDGQEGRYSTRDLAVQASQEEKKKKSLFYKINK